MPGGSESHPCGIEIHPGREFPNSVTAALNRTLVVLKLAQVVALGSVPLHSESHPCGIEIGAGRRFGQ